MIKRIIKCFFIIFITVIFLFAIKMVQPSNNNYDNTSYFFINSIK